MAEILRSGANQGEIQEYQAIPYHIDLIRYFAFLKCAATLEGMVSDHNPFPLTEADRVSAPIAPIMRPKNSRSKTVAIRLGLVLLAEVIWFSLAYPMVPATGTGFTIELTSGIIVAAALWGGARNVVARRRRLGGPVNRSRVLVAASFILMLATTALGAGASSLRASLEVRYAQMKSAMNTHDARALRAVLAPGFVSIELDGKTESADDMIRELDAVPTDADRSSKTALLSIRPGKTRTVVEQRYSMTTKKKGQDGLDHNVKLVAVSTDTWITVHGQWRIQRTVTDQLDYYIDGKHVLHRRRAERVAP